MTSILLWMLGSAGAHAAVERPWEVSTDQGETLLPDIYYAEGLQTQQIMPTALLLGEDADQGPWYGINRLIYPTLGNPNLFLQGDPRETLLVVLRVETSLVDALDLVVHQPRDRGKPRHLKRVTFRLDPLDELRIFLVKRNAPIRKAEQSAALNEGGDVFRIRPSEVWMLNNRNAFVPKPFQDRYTFRMSFDQEAMSAVPPGLYDVRFELHAEGRLRLSEFHYNAVRIFSTEFSTDTYRIVNVTDTQVSLGEKDGFVNLTTRYLERFVAQYSEPGSKELERVAFITFNGDLHNGSSPLTLFPNEVAWSYYLEARTIVRLLKNLQLPIFLTPGNHDGLVSFGHVPKTATRTARLTGRLSLKEVLRDAAQFRREAGEEEVTPAELWDQLARGLERFPAAAGNPVDLYVGQFTRRAEQKVRKDWVRVPESQRNVVLYDGFNQWRRTYGPLHYSWSFGENHFVSLNSFELRQHARVGWGLYTVNYGGGMGLEQLAWLKRDLETNQRAQRDITLLAHHDPRGGHRGRDFPYYVKQKTFAGIPPTLAAFIRGEIVQPVLCERLPKERNRSILKLFTDRLDRETLELSCLHDGLQEWMRPDTMFDCANQYLIRDPSNHQRRVCDFMTFAPGQESKHHPRYSGYSMVHYLTSYSHLRTMVLGHTHYNSLEVYYPGEVLVPESVILDGPTHRRLIHVEKAHPARAVEIEEDGLIRQENETFKLMLEQAGHGFNRTLKAHELVILRVTTVAQLADQVYKPSLFDGQKAQGFSVLSVTNPGRTGYAYPHITGVDLWRAAEGKAHFLDTGIRVTLPRERRTVPLPCEFHPRDAFNLLGNYFADQNEHYCEALQ